MDEATGQRETGLYEWDIELTPEQRAIIEEGWLRNGTDDHQHGERKGISDLNYRWTNKKVVYTLTSAPSRYTTIFVTVLSVLQHEFHHDCCRGVTGLGASLCQRAQTAGLTFLLKSVRNGEFHYFI